MKNDSPNSVMKKMFWLWDINGRKIREAKEIWLYCIDHNLKIPQKVLSVFTEDVRNQVIKSEVDHPNVLPLQRFVENELTAKEQKAYEIYKQREMGGKTYDDMAEKFDVSRKTVERAVAFGKERDFVKNRKRRYD